MTPSYSLARRLNRSLLLPLALIWIGAAAGSAWHTQAEVGRVLDAALFESAQRLLEIATHELSGHDVPLDEMTLSKVSPPLPTGTIVEDDNLMYQVLSNRGHMLIRSSDAPKTEMAVPLADGFFDTLEWRVYTLKTRLCRCAFTSVHRACIGSSFKSPRCCGSCCRCWQCCR